MAKENYICHGNKLKNFPCLTFLFCLMVCTMYSDDWTLCFLFISHAQRMWSKNCHVKFTMVQWKATWIAMSYQIDMAKENYLCHGNKIEEFVMPNFFCLMVCTMYSNDCTLRFFCICHAQCTWSKIAMTNLPWSPWKQKFPLSMKVKVAMEVANTYVGVILFLPCQLKKKFTMVHKVNLPWP